MHAAIRLALLLSLVCASTAFGQGVSFQVFSLPRNVRGEGRTETVGEVSLRAASGGNITPGSSITLSYDARITNTPTVGGNLTCGFGGAPPTTAACTVVGMNMFFSGSQFTIEFTRYVIFDINDLINIFGVRLDIGQLSPGVTVVNVTLSGVSSAPATNPISFNNATSTVANVVRPSTSVVLPTAAGTTGPAISPPGLLTCAPGTIQFGIVVTETFPSAFTTLAQERAFSSTPLASSRLRLRVRLFGVPAAFTVGPISTTGSSATLTFQALPGSVAQTISGQLISFDFTFADFAPDGVTPGTRLDLIETAVLNFQLSHTGGAPVAAGGLTGPITAEVQLRVIEDPLPSQTIISFALNAYPTPRATVATVNDCVPGIPGVVTQPASSITRSSTVLNAVVNPNGSATTVSFQWGIDPTLASFTSTAPQPIGSGFAFVAVAAPVSPLTPATTYYFRAVATNSIGTTVGPILNFRTRTVTQIFVTRNSLHEDSGHSTADGGLPAEEKSARRKPQPTN